MVIVYFVGFIVQWIMNFDYYDVIKKASRIRDACLDFIID